MFPNRCCGEKRRCKEQGTNRGTVEFAMLQKGRVTMTVNSASVADVLPVGDSKRGAVRKLNGSLGVTSIVLMVIAAASPLTVVGGVVPLGVGFGNGIGFPSLYLFATLVLFLFSVGFAAMTKSVPKPGAFFTYVGHGLGRPAGVAAAWLAILTYTTVQIAVYGYIGAVLSSTVSGLTGGVNIPWWVFAFGILAIVGVFGYRNLEMSSKVLGVLLMTEIGIVLILAAAVVISDGAEGLSAQPFIPKHVFSGSVGNGLMFAISAFIGFEATAIFRDEARDPDKTIPRATYIAVIGVGLFYALASWGLIMGWGPSQAVAKASAGYESIVIATAAQYLGVFGQVAMNVLILTGMFACILSFHNVLTRYQHSMSVAGLLPERLSHVHSKESSPHISSLVQTATAGVLITLFAIIGLDPVTQVFTWFAGVTTVSIVVLMAVTAIAVMVYFARTKLDTRLMQTKVAPALGFVGLVVCTVAIISNFPLLVGEMDANGNPVFGVVSWVLLMLTVIFPALGYAQALFLKRRDPERYEHVISNIAG